MKCVFIVLDTVRRDYLSTYGNDWVHTPALDRLAERGVVFDNHWVGSLPCMPARREFMTGRYNFIYRGWGPIEPYDDTLPGELRKNDVFTHLLTDHYHYFELGGENYHTAFNTWDFFRGQENDWWASHVDRMALPDHLGQLSQQNYGNRKLQQREEDFSGPKTAQAAIEWLKTNRASDDWFLQVEIFDPHEPFYCTEKYRAMYGDDYDGPFYDWPSYDEVHESPEAVEHIRKCYAGLLTMTDHWVGRIFDTLDDLGLWDDTLVVFTTDHGTMLAEHDFWMKNIMPLYNEIVRIPLIASLPGNERADTRTGALTQTIDLMPTFLDYFDTPVPPHVQGTVPAKGAGRRRRPGGRHLRLFRDGHELNGRKARVHAQPGQRGRGTAVRVHGHAHGRSEPLVSQGGVRPGRNGPVLRPYLQPPVVQDPHRRQGPAAPPRRGVLRGAEPAV